MCVGGKFKDIFKTDFYISTKCFNCKIEQIKGWMNKCKHCE